MSAVCNNNSGMSRPFPLRILVADLESAMLECYAWVDNRFFGLNTYFTESTQLLFLNFISFVGLSSYLTGDSILLYLDQLFLRHHPLYHTRSVL
jgi:hypothetical protein